jgi:dimethylamine monooxygenase subunit A
VPQEFARVSAGLRRTGQYGCSPAAFARKTDSAQNMYFQLLRGPVTDLQAPLRYLPHMQSPELLHMGLSPMPTTEWIEPDADALLFYRHKLRQRQRLDERVWRALPASQPAQKEAARLLAAHLQRDYPTLFSRQGQVLVCAGGKFSVPVDSPEPLWNSSLWIADDLVLMEQRGKEYVLTAASLCSPSHWRLEDKFDRSMSTIHELIPGIDVALQPRIERFFAHLRVEHPVVRHNWSVQAGSELCVRPGEERESTAGELYYRSERQSLRRLPNTGAIVFTIRVYLHPLAALAAVPGAIAQLLAAIDACSPGLYQYKGFAALEDALAVWRRSSAEGAAPP